MQFTTKAQRHKETQRRNNINSSSNIGKASKWSAAFCFITLFLLLTITSCKELADQSMPNDIVFFDLKKFMSKEAERLQQINPTVKKTTRVNDNTETKVLNLEEYHAELKIFQEADINKMAWVDKYSADTVMIENQLSSIVYKAKAENLITRELRLTI